MSSSMDHVLGLARARSPLVASIASCWIIVARGTGISAAVIMAAMIVHGYGARAGNAPLSVS